MNCGFHACYCTRLDFQIYPGSLLLPDSILILLCFYFWRPFVAWNLVGLRAKHAPSWKEAVKNKPDWTINLRFAGYLGSQRDSVKKMIGIVV